MGTASSWQAVEEAHAPKRDRPGGGDAGLADRAVRLKWVSRNGACPEEVRDGSSLVLESFELVPLPSSPLPSTVLTRAAASLLAQLVNEAAGVTVTAVVPLADTEPTASPPQQQLPAAKL